MSLDVDLLRRHEGPLVWGVNDCVQFAADAVERYGGWRPELPKYSSEREAIQIIARGGGLEALVTRVMGEPIHVKDARIGDTVLTVFRDTGPMLGVADPRGFWVRASEGFLPLDLEFALRVWPWRR
jgi:uncharacterized protein DUF6950